MKAIGIDIGTTSISGVVYDRETKGICASRTVPGGCWIETGREWERIQDANRLAERTYTLLTELAGAYPDVASIGLTGQMHGILYTDGEGRQVSPLYTWQDGRAARREFNGKSILELAWERTGRQLHAGYGLATHLYLARAGQIPARAASLCTIGDYFGMRLCQRNRPLLHASNGASLGFFDIEEGGFDTGALRTLGMGTELLPEVTADFRVLGEWKGIPVTGSIGDNQASFLGAVGLSEDALLLNMGTGGQISVLSKTPYQRAGIEARPMVPGKYLLVGASLCGGRAYAALEHFFRSYIQAATGSAGPQYEVLNRLAEKGAAQPGRLAVETTFMGTREDPDRRGSITGIREDNFTPEALAYGVLEGMTRELYGLYLQIQEGTGIRAKRLVASGNGFRKNPVLRRICQELFQMELELARCQEEAACGAAASSISEDLSGPWCGCP